MRQRSFANCSIRARIDTVKRLSSLNWMTREPKTRRTIGDRSGVPSAFRRRRIGDLRVERKLVAVVYADMVAYSKLIGADDAGTMFRMHALRQDIIDRAVTDHGGHIVQTAGNSMLIMFDSVTQAVSCAISVQRGVLAHQKDEDAQQRIQFRMGIEIGDVIADGKDFHGDGVNIAARLQTVCPPGDICVSRTVRDHVKVRLGLNFRPLGVLPLKNIARPIEAFVIEIVPEQEASAESDGQRSLRGTPHIVGLPLIAASIEHGSVAVLPFANLGASSSDNYLGEGIVEDIIAKLASYHELTVISRSSTLGYRGGGVDAATVGRQLGVRYVMNGSVTRGGQRLKIMAELSDTEYSRVVWTGRFDGVARNLFDIQDEMTAQIVHHIAPQVHANELRRIRLKRPDSMDAYDLVLQALGLHHLFDRKMFAKERQLLRRAMKLDPGYAMPYALLAEWYSLRFGQGWSASAGPKDVLEADRLAAAAIERDPNNVRALAIYGHNRSFMFRDYDRAIVFLERALNAAPSSAQAWCYSSPTYSYIGEGKAAIERAERGLRLSPRDPVAFWYYSALALGHLTQGAYADAAHWSNRAYRENPGYLANLRYS